MNGGSKRIAVAWSRHDARRIGGTSSMSWNTAPALDTASTAAPSMNHAYFGGELFATRPTSPKFCFHQLVLRAYDSRLPEESIDCPC